MPTSLRAVCLPLASAGVLLFLSACGGESPVPPRAEGDDGDAPVAERDDAGGEETAAASTSEPSPYVGPWDMSDIDGKPLDVVIHADGTAVSNWTEPNEDNSSYSMFGEFGVWEEQEGRVIISYDSGWKDVIQKDGDNFAKLTFSPGFTVNDDPSAEGRARRVVGPKVPFIGLWQGGSNPVFFIALKSDGTAAKSTSLLATGTWTVPEGGNFAEIRWSDGKLNRLKPVGGAYELEIYEAPRKVYGRVEEEAIEETPPPPPPPAPAPAEETEVIAGEETVAEVDAEGEPVVMDTVETDIAEIVTPAEEPPAPAEEAVAEATPDGPPAPEGPKPLAVYPIVQMRKAPANP